MILQIINELVKDKPAIQEKAVLAGILPGIIDLVSDKYDEEARIEALCFLHEACYVQTLRMYMASDVVGTILQLLGVEASQEKQIQLLARSFIRKIFTTINEAGPEVSIQYGSRFLESMIDCGKAVNNPFIIRNTLSFITEFMSSGRHLVELGCNGIIKAVIEYASPSNNHLEVRTQAALLLRELLHLKNKDIEKTMIASGVIPTIVNLLEEDYDQFRLIVLVGITCLDAISHANILAAKGEIGKGDIAKMLMNTGLAPKLANTLSQINRDRKIDFEDYFEPLSQIFGNLISSDKFVRNKLVQREILKPIVNEIENLAPVQVLKMVKHIRYLAGDYECCDAIQRAGAIPVLIRLLDRRHGENSVEICNAVIWTMYNFCKLSKKRQEYAANAGLVPHLLYFANLKNQSTDIPIEMLCDLANAGEKPRKILWNYGVLDFYLELLTVQKMFIKALALKSIVIWLSEEKEDVDRILLEQENCEKFVRFFVEAEDATVLEPLTRILVISKHVPKKFAKVIPLILQRLNHPRPDVKQGLLKMLKPILEQQTNIPKELVKSELRKYSEGESGLVVVQELARNLIEIL